MSNLGPVLLGASSGGDTVLLGVAAVIVAITGFVALFVRAKPPETPAPVSAYEDVQNQLRVLRDTIHDLEEQLRQCRTGRAKLERLLEESRAERGQLLERLARIGDDQ